MTLKRNRFYLDEQRIKLVESELENGKKIADSLKSCIKSFRVTNRIGCQSKTDEQLKAEEDTIEFYEALIEVVMSNNSASTLSLVVCAEFKQVIIENQNILNREMEPLKGANWIWKSRKVIAWILGLLSIFAVLVAYIQDYIPRGPTP